MCFLAERCPSPTWCCPHLLQLFFKCVVGTENINRSPSHSKGPSAVWVPVNQSQVTTQTFTDISEQNYFFFLKEHIDVQQLEWKEYKERQSERIRATFQKSDARNVWSAANYASSWETRPLLAARQCLVLTLFGAHVCLFVISLPRTRYNANRRTRSQAGGLWWKVLESVVSRNFSATSWTHPRFCQQQCCFLSLCVFCPSAFQRAQSKRTTHVLVCKIFFFFF